MAKKAKKKKTKTRKPERAKRSIPLARTFNRAGSNASKTIRNVTQATLDAAVELGRAADAFKHSLRHVKMARSRGRSAMRPVKKAGKKAYRTARRTLARTR